jgi:hypothetical protein
LAQTVTVSRVLPAVRRSALAIISRSLGSKRDRSPTTFSRMLLACIFETSRSSAVTNRRISSETSSSGRRQFSEENANRVRYSTPRSTQASTTPRTASTPLTCPATRGSKRLVAQRPLPSMMMAIWRGTAGTSGTTVVELLKIINPCQVANTVETR